MASAAARISASGAVRAAGAARARRASASQHARTSRSGTAAMLPRIGIQRGEVRGGRGRRHSPGARSPSASAPMATRTSSRTSCPTAAHIRRTWRFLPSVRTISSQHPPSRPDPSARTTAGRDDVPSPRGTPSAQRAQRLRARHAAHPGVVGLRHLVAGIGEPMAEAMVVGEDQQAGGVLVEAPHREDPAVEPVQELVHGEPPAGIGAGRDVADRLVERDGHALGLVARADAVHGDHVPPRIDASRGKAAPPRRPPPRGRPRSSARASRREQTPNLERARARDSGPLDSPAAAASGRPPGRPRGGLMPGG